MKFTSIFLLFQLLSITAFAQITIETERDENGNVLFFSKNPEIVPYSVILNFATLQNMTSTGGDLYWELRCREEYVWQP